MQFQTTSGGGLAQCALDAHQSECALGVNVPNRIHCTSNSVPSASVNGPLRGPLPLMLFLCKASLLLPTLLDPHDLYITR